jgi:hypothetical protein
VGGHAVQRAVPWIEPVAGAVLHRQGFPHQAFERPGNFGSGIAGLSR